VTTPTNVQVKKTESYSTLDSLAEIQLKRLHSDLAEFTDEFTHLVKQDKGVKTAEGKLIGIPVAWMPYPSRELVMHELTGMYKSHRELSIYGHSVGTYNDTFYFRV